MKSKMMNDGFRVSVSMIICVYILAGCIAPDNAYLMELNRSGKWKEVERIGLDMLRNRGTFSHGQICETYFHVIYAQTRMGKKADAVRYMAEYEDCSARGVIDPELLWLNREITELKRELGLLDKIQATIVLAMEENGRGNYAEARELCDTVLAMEGANEIQRATATFVAAVCSIRLKEAGRAEEYLEEFDSLKGALPPGHLALVEESFARQGLRELLTPLGE